MRTETSATIIGAALLLVWAAGCENAGKPRSNRDELGNCAAKAIDAGDFDLAIKCCTEAIQLDPKYAKAYSDRGVAYWEKNHWDKAMADWSEAIRLDPKLAAAHYCRGVAYGRKGQADKAIADFTDAIRLDPNFAEARYNRGVAYQNKGDADKAKSDFDQAKKLGYQPDGL